MLQKAYRMKSWLYRIARRGSPQAYMAFTLDPSPWLYPLFLPVLQFLSKPSHRASSSTCTLPAHNKARLLSIFNPLLPYNIQMLLILKVNLSGQSVFHLTLLSLLGFSTILSNCVTAKSLHILTTVQLSIKISLFKSCYRRQQ